MSYTRNNSATVVGVATEHGQHAEDVLVFAGLESLGTLAITGNLCLIAVLVRNRYLHRASFILMLSLAIADVVHGVVTTTFFYPPILLGRLAMPPTGVRIFNVLDWTAWAITLTHMSAICLDRLTAIMFYTQYSQLITVHRTKFFTVACWTLFALLNLAYILGGFCCLITPLSSNHFYTFGYGEFETSTARSGLLNGWFDANIFTLTYTPLELAAIALLTVCNPTTLLQLYRRHKRKMALKIQMPSIAPPFIEDQAYSSSSTLRITRNQWQRASAMLVEMSMRMGSKAIVGDVRELASRRANRQQQRILLQISVVTSMFYAYMAAYYLVYHVFEINNKWVVLANSIFYSVTHMMNPVIYFSLNKEMRAQLRQVVADVLRFACCGSAEGVLKRGGSEFVNGSMATRARSEGGAGGDRRPCAGSGTSAMLDSSGGGGARRWSGVDGTK